MQNVVTGGAGANTSTSSFLPTAYGTSGTDFASNMAQQLGMSPASFSSLMQGILNPNSAQNKAFLSQAGTLFGQGPTNIQSVVDQAGGVAEQTKWVTDMQNQFMGSLGSGAGSMLAGLQGGDAAAKGISPSSPQLAASTMANLVAPFTAGNYNKTSNQWQNVANGYLGLLPNLLMGMMQPGQNLASAMFSQPPGQWNTMSQAPAPANQNYGAGPSSPAMGGFNQFGGTGALGNSTAPAAAQATGYGGYQPPAQQQGTTPTDAGTPNNQGSRSGAPISGNSGTSPYYSGFSDTSGPSGSFFNDPNQYYVDPSQSG